MPQRSRKTPGSRKPPEPPPLKILCAEITGPEQQVRRFLSEHPQEPTRTTRKDEIATVEVFVPEALLARVRERGLKVQVLYDASARGRERQKEVGKGNRFEGKNRVPKGLGVKTKEGGRELP
jgi:hypothetical protein